MPTQSAVLTFSAPLVIESWFERCRPLLYVCPVCWCSLCAIHECRALGNAEVIVAEIPGEARKLTRESFVDLPEPSSLLKYPSRRIGPLRPPATDTLARPHETQQVA
jgi:hypothetical protein